jgi:alpha-L-fucosidase 2
VLARGGFEVDIYWQNGKLANAKIKSLLGKPCKLRYGDKVIELSTQTGKSYVLDSNLKQK